jgi:hypothetical protein
MKQPWHANRFILFFCLHKKNICSLTITCEPFINLILLQLGWQDMAFVFLNCFLDIDEAIDDQDGKTSFNRDIITYSDIPHDFQLPSKHCIEGKLNQIGLCQVLIIYFFQST